MSQYNDCITERAEAIKPHPDYGTASEEFTYLKDPYKVSSLKIIEEEH